MKILTKIKDVAIEQDVGGSSEQDVGGASEQGVGGASEQGVGGAEGTRWARSCSSLSTGSIM